MELKKVFKVLATGSLAAALMVGCSKPAENDNASKTPAKGSDKTAQTELKPEDGSYTLTLWDNGDAEGKWAQFVGTEFHKKYPSINVQYQKVNHVDAPAKVAKDGPVGKAADVFQAPHDHVGEMIASGTVFENVSDDAYKTRFVDSAVKGTSGVDPKSKDIKMYGFPIAVETYALFYNKDLVKEPAKTMDELFAQSKEFMKKNPGSYGLMLEPGNFYFNYAYLGGYGGYVFGNDNTNPADLGLNNEGAVKSAEFMKKIHDELLPMKKEDINGNLIGDLFKKNKVMYRVSGPWDVQGAKDAKVNFGIVPLPTLDNGKHPTSFSGIKAYYVSKYSKHPKAATLLAQFASSDEMLMKRFEMTGQLPPSKALAENEKIKNDPYVSPFLEQAKYATPMPNIVEMGKVWGPMEQAYTLVWNGKAQPKDALDSVTKQIEDSIKKQQK